jgi:hypothetical protein
MGESNQIMTVLKSDSHFARAITLLSLAALHETLGRHKRADGIWIGSITWFVSARNPAN